MEHKEYRQLHAEWDDLVSGGRVHTEEINFWVRSIEASSEPVLELGSGTGRRSGGWSDSAIFAILNQTSANVG